MAITSLVLTGLAISASSAAAAEQARQADKQSNAIRDELRRQGKAAAGAQRRRGAAGAGTRAVLQASSGVDLAKGSAVEAASLGVAIDELNALTVERRFFNQGQIVRSQGKAARNQAILSGITNALSMAASASSMGMFGGGGGQQLQAQTGLGGSTASGVDSIFGTGTASNSLIFNRNAGNSTLIGQQNTSLGTTGQSLGVRQ